LRTTAKLGAYIMLFLGAFFACPAPANADQWQAAVGPAAILAVRRLGSTTPYTATFSVTSPLGAQRSASVVAHGDEEAAVTFGDHTKPKSIWGLDNGKFNPSIVGTWSWTCSVAGKIVARGTFIIQRTGGRESLETSQALFK
jgi:hypothetical protein